MADPYYLTTPIYYATGDPHLGHAYTTLLADTIARYRRQAGHEVMFLTGTDEHGQKIQEEAASRGVDPIDLCDDMAARFKAAWEELGVSHNRFIRTTEDDHKAVVTAFLEKLWDSGQIYRGEYTGWYSVSQERYFTEKEIGPDRVDPIAGKPVEQIEEVNYFFRMGSFQERLIEHIRSNPRWIVPESRKNEVLGFLNQPLEDLSISRPRSRISWGIPLPFDPEHVAYVWVDALINYVTASGIISPDAARGARGFGSDGSGTWWPADLHLMGKDILTTHAVYWPTLLMGAELPLPKQILAHGWWVAGDRKMSKSLGNVVDPLDLRRDFGTDAVRWYLMREMPTGGDASFTMDRFEARYGELSNVLGNLASRVTSMVARYLDDGVLTDAPADGLAAESQQALDEFEAAMQNLQIHDAFAAAMELARAANGFVETQEPWALAKDPARRSELEHTLSSLVSALVVLTALFLPVMPEKMSALANRLGLEKAPTLGNARSFGVAGLKISKGEPLFPRVDLEAADG